MDSRKLAHRFSLGTVLLAFCSGMLFAQQPAENLDPIVALRSNPPKLVALEHARIITRPGQVLEDAALLIDGDRIVAVGKLETLPPGTQRIDMQGKSIYPGLIDAGVDVPLEGLPPNRGAPYWNANITPQRHTGQLLESLPAAADRRKSGVTVALVAPQQGIIKGSSCVLLLGDGTVRDSLLREQAAQHLRLTLERAFRLSGYPTSPMGAVALARQAFYDSQWYRGAWEAYRSQPDSKRPELNAALEELAHRTSELLFIADAPTELYALRADAFAREFALDLAIRGSGREYRRAAEIARLGRVLLLPVEFPKAPNVATAETAQAAELDQLMHWELAPENPARMRAAGASICLVSAGLESPSDFIAGIRTAVERGLSADDALAATTTTPARLLGIERFCGSISPGLLANLVVADGELFAKKTKVLETWVAGKRFEHTPPKPEVPTTSFSLQLNGGPVDGASATLEIIRKDEKTEAALVGTATTTDGKSRRSKLDKLQRSEDQLTATFKARDFDDRAAEGTALLSLTVIHPPGAETRLQGSIVWPDGQASQVRGTPAPPPAETETPKPAESAAPATESATPTAETPAAEGTAPPSSSDKEPAAAPAEGEGTPASEPASGEQASTESGSNPPASKDSEPKAEDAEKWKQVLSTVNFPFGAFGRTTAVPEAPVAVVFRDATVWTSADAGKLSGADVYVRDGKIIAVGVDLVVPADVQQIDASAYHISPGIIDCHSHMATDGGINEVGQVITAEVRIGDFIDSNDISIYRQLAGGVTTANILHGSANPIGGQNQVIKLRWGGMPDELKLADAPLGIKCALGENPKQSNFPSRSGTRYPNSRMGVEQIFVDQFRAAQEYKAAHESYRRNPQGPPPRRDLQLEALVEVLDGDRWIHCHSYRQDEIQAFLDVLDRFSIKIGSLQHILEGYKVADRLAAHGAMASSFSDWWAYKIEVMDAIPHNGALLHQRGVVVSFNSDDAELARHLNHEAAKAVKYGGVTPEEALKFVTLNPAKQLRIDRWVGSLEPGKDADLVLWSGDPLSTLSRCEQTWVDGRPYFDRQSDAQLRAQQKQLHAQLVQKVLATRAGMSQPGEEKLSLDQLWPRHDIYCGHGHHDEHFDHWLDHLETIQLETAAD
jgi:N-acetylglucosamine-6-phosphate deacetylase